MKHLITLEAKQGKVANNHAMRACVMILSHYGRGGELGAVGKLVRWHTIVIISFFFVLKSICLWNLTCMWTCSFVVS